MLTLFSIIKPPIFAGFQCCFCTVLSRYRMMQDLYTMTRLDMRTILYFNLTSECASEQLCPFCILKVYRLCISNSLLI